MKPIKESHLIGIQHSVSTIIHLTHYKSHIVNNSYLYPLTPWETFSIHQSTGYLLNSGLGQRSPTGSYQLFRHSKKITQRPTLGYSLKLFFHRGFLCTFCLIALFLVLILPHVLFLDYQNLFYAALP